MSVIRIPQDPETSARVMAREVALDLEAVMRGDVRADNAGLRAFLAVHSVWWLHGFCVDPSMAWMRSFSIDVFASETRDRYAFVRGMLSLADVGVEDGCMGIASPEDRAIFWSCVAGLSRSTGIPITSERPSSSPLPRGH